MIEKTEKIWDDAAFKARVKARAKALGMSLGQALVAAGISQKYLAQPSEGRSTNHVLRIARALDMQPAELLGLEASPVPPIDQQRLHCIVAAAEMMTAQLAALMYVASARSDLDPAALMQLVIKKLNGKKMAETLDDQGSGPGRDGSST